MKKSESKMEKKSERVEAIVKLLIVVVSGFVFYCWSVLALVLTIFNWLYTITLGERNRWAAQAIELYNTYVYVLFRYVGGVSNQRPFPFSGLEPLGKFE